MIVVSKATTLDFTCPKGHITRLTVARHEGTAYIMLDMLVCEWLVPGPVGLGHFGNNIKCGQEMTHAALKDKDGV